MTLRAVWFIAAVLIHEAGHLAAIKLSGARIRGFGLHGGGMLISYDRADVGYTAEAAICLSGAAANLIAAMATRLIAPTAVDFITVNLAFALFNLTPVRGLDGGGALYSLMCRCSSDLSRADAVCGIASTVSLTLMWAASVWVQIRVGGDLCLMLVILYLIIKSVGK